MQERRPELPEEIEIDLGRVFRAVLRRWVALLLAGALCAGGVFAGMSLLASPKYQSSVLFYVYSTAPGGGSAQPSGDLTTARKLVGSYIVVLNTRQTLGQIIQTSGTDKSARELEKMITAEAVEETEFFEVTVTGGDPVEAERIADAIADILPERISSVIEGTAVKVADAAVLPTRSASPGRVKMAAIGFAMGVVLAAAVIALRELLDVRIRREADLARVTDLPVLASVPDMTVPGALRQITAGSRIPFGAAEAYKLLRTKLQYSFSADTACRVIGITSAGIAEGKSLTAVNLAWALSQLQCRVLLMDCDMRRPSLADKLDAVKEPGLSAYLSGQCDLEGLVRSCGFADQPDLFRLVVSGRIPPNPVELLGSARMQDLLEKLRREYDYILLDLPPVGAVSDGLVLAKEMDGVLLVARQDRCTRTSLSEAIRQLSYVGSRILGIVYNGTREQKSGKAGYDAYYGPGET